MKKVLFVCTQNSCRSQMAEGIVNHDLAGRLQAFSAGTSPSAVNPFAIDVMSEIGIDITGQRSKHLDEFAGRTFDLVVTLCGEAAESCPFASGLGPVRHVGFEDPALAVGDRETILSVFRRVRDEMRKRLLPFLVSELGLS
ncbi:MAG: arsenate reductase ArsC [Deltaproteobacteria bacterium]